MRYCVHAAQVFVLRSWNNLFGGYEIVIKNFSKYKSKNLRFDISFMDENCIDILYKVVDFSKRFAGISFFGYPYELDEFIYFADNSDEFVGIDIDIYDNNFDNDKINKFVERFSHERFLSDCERLSSVCYMETPYGTNINIKLYIHDVGFSEDDKCRLVKDVCEIIKESFE